MKNSIINAVSKMLINLYANGSPNKRILASVRHANSVSSPQAQPIWPILMAELEYDDLSHNGEPTYAEKAAYTAIRLYAIHQQGNDKFVYSNSKSKRNEQPEGLTLFSVLAKLRGNTDAKIALDRRVKALLATTNVDSVINSLTHLVAIIKQQKLIVPVDYARLAQDLYYFQMSYEYANQIRLNWGRQYFYETSNNKQAKDEGVK